MSEFIKDIKAHKGILVIIASVALFLGMMAYYQVTNFHAFTANIISQKFAAHATRFEDTVGNVLFMDICPDCDANTVAELVKGELPLGLQLSGKNLVGTFQKAGTYTFMLKLGDDTRMITYVVK